MANSYYSGDLPMAVEEVAARLSIKDARFDLKSIKIGKEEEKKGDNPEPEDRYYFVLIVVTIMGLVHFLPMSYFSAANEYWMYKFRNTTLNTTDANARTYLQKNFVSLTGIYNSIAAFFANCASTLLAHKILAKTRVIGVLTLHTAVFAVLMLFTNINTDEWQEIFFVITVACMILVVCTVQMMAGAGFNLVTKLPPMYVKGFINGEGVASIFTSILRLLSIMMSPSTVGAALIYFASGAALFCLNIVLCLIMFRMDFFKYYTKDLKEETKESARSPKEIFGMIKYIWPMIPLGGLLLYTVPMASIYNLVVSEDYGEDGTTWGNKYFVTLCTFLIPSFTDMAGRLLFNKLNWILPIPVQYVVLAVYQATFTVLLYMTNARPRTHYSVLLGHDWQYALVMSVYAFFKGFASNMTALTTLSLVPANRTELAMMMLYLTSGLWLLAYAPLGLLAVSLL